MPCQVEELNKKLAQHEKATRSQQQRVKVGRGSWGGSAVELGGRSDPIPSMQVLEGELQSEATRQQERMAELQEQLAQKEQAAEHYKAQVSRCKPSPSLRSAGEP